MRINSFIVHSFFIRYAIIIRNQAFRLQDLRFFWSRGQRILRRVALGTRMVTR